MFYCTTNFNEGASSAGASGDAPVVESAPSEEGVKVSTSKQYKINGKVVDVPLEKIDTYAQLGLSSDERFKEAKKLKEEAQNILDTAKNSRSAFKALELAGFSKQEAREIIEAELRKEYEEEELSPDEKARRKEKAELESFRKAEAERKEAIEQEAESKAEETELLRIDEEIAEAIKGSDLPPHPILGKWAVQYMAAFAQNGEDLSAKEAMKLVGADMKNIIKTMLSDMDATAVKQYLKTDHVKGLQDEVLKEFQSKQKPFGKPAVAPNQAKSEPTPKVHQTISSKDFFNKKRSF